MCRCSLVFALLILSDALSPAYIFLTMIRLSNRFICFFYYIFIGNPQLTNTKKNTMCLTKELENIFNIFFLTLIHYFLCSVWLKYNLFSFCLWICVWLVVVLSLFFVFVRLQKKHFLKFLYFMNENDLFLYAAINYII